MDHTFTARPAFTVVGIKYRGRNDNEEIPALWDSFFPDKAALIEHKVDPHVAYGVEDNLDMATGEFDYVAGYEVPSDSPTPAGLERWEIPAQSYAVFATSLPVIRQTFDYVYREWLPQSGYHRVPGPEFELYDQNFDPANGKLDMYLYVPVAAGPERPISELELREIDRQLASMAEDKLYSELDLTIAEEFVESDLEALELAEGKN